MEVVLGSGPLAEAFAARLQRTAPAMLAGSAAKDGAFLWRRANLESGEGLRAALADARRVHVVIDEVSPCLGAFAAIEASDAAAGLLVVPLGSHLPAACPDVDNWGLVEVGPCWGAEEPLVHRWSQIIRRGAHLWLADPGPVHAVALPDAVQALVAASERKSIRWRIPGERTSLPDLAQALSFHHRRPLRATRVPLRWAMDAAGVDAARVWRWTQAPGGPWHTPGWSPSQSRTSGWVLGL